MDRFGNATLTRPNARSKQERRKPNKVTGKMRNASKSTSQSPNISTSTSTTKNGSATAAVATLGPRTKVTKKAAWSTTAIPAKFIRRWSPAHLIFLPTPSGSASSNSIARLRHADRDRISAARPPITRDIEIDLDRLKERLKKGEYKIRNQRLEVTE